MPAVGKIPGWPAATVALLAIGFTTWLELRSGGGRPAMREGGFSSVVQSLMAVAPEPIRSAGHEMCQELAERPMLVCRIDDRSENSVPVWAEGFERAGWSRADGKKPGAPILMTHAAGRARIEFLRKRQEIIVTLEPRNN